MDLKSYTGLMSVCLVLGLSACATDGATKAEVQHAQATADQALSTANQALNQANDASAKADQAMSTSNQTREQLQRMGQKGMMK
ncbi:MULTISPECIES: alanine-zipper protein [Microvirgula]|uniref:Lipoprotein n=1 Tax=Microvirgula aerodenitrificans TaxID=57480 RepID=A0A2S0P8X0_9NEIS|nr:MULTISPECIES: alanine-zipper protein [Microvirgula]AVY93806.1 hypothetical protein DAI18_06925 [Microvirgula aerodenitrificans]RAS14233.1 uncharacterized protein DUF3359 [Microvirgula sp. AG722]